MHCGMPSSLPGLQASTMPSSRDNQKWLLGAASALAESPWVRGFSSPPRDSIFHNHLTY